MIEKKISYEINIEKPSKTKPVKQGGVFNYLGKQKTVNAPRHWRSSPKHPIAHLSYITKDEQKILIDLNLYGSLKGKPNKGPFGLPSLQGSGSGSGGDGGSSGGDGGQGDSGPGGSDDGSGHGGPGPGSGEGESTGDANDQGGTEGPGGSQGESTGDAPGTQGGTVSEAQAAAESVSADNVSTQAQADQEDAATAAAANTGVMGSLSNAVQNAIANAVNNPMSTIAGLAFGPVAGLAARGISAAVDAANRGVTGPSDDTQESSSVQSGPSQSSGGDGGITTLPQYAPLYNQTTGDSLLDSLIARYRANLPPSSFGI
jgi:hypothetical protein